MKVALFGSTGFVGTYITEELLKNNHTPHLLVRPGSEYKVFQPVSYTHLTLPTIYSV